MLVRHMQPYIAHIFLGQSSASRPPNASRPTNGHPYPSLLAVVGHDLKLEWHLLYSVRHDYDDGPIP